MFWKTCKLNNINVVVQRTRVCSREAFSSYNTTCQKKKHADFAPKAIVPKSNKEFTVIILLSCIYTWK